MMSTFHAIPTDQQANGTNAHHTAFRAPAPITSPTAPIAYRHDPYSDKAFCIVQGPMSPFGRAPASLGSVRSRSLSQSSRDSSSYGSGNDGVSSSFSAEEHAAAHIVDELLKEHVDSAIERQVDELGAAGAQQVAIQLGHMPAAMHNLCAMERGNVMYHVAKRCAVLGVANACRGMYAFVAANFMRFSLDQSGCVAVSRMIEAATGDDKQTVVGLAVENFKQLAPHQYGNYTVQAALTVADEDTLSRLGLLMSEVDAVLGLTGSKFGSHVVEKFVKSAPISHVTGVVQSALGCSATLHHLAHDRFANYVLQAMLTALATSNRQVSQQLLMWVGEKVASQLATTPHAPNLRKRLALLFK